MNLHRESKKERYDVVVIGSGLGGLTVAALLARAGKDVLVIERHDRLGGYAHSFRRPPYHFDSSVHLTSGCEPVAYAGGAAIHRVLDAVGVREQCEFLRVDPFCDAVFPGLHLSAPVGAEAFCQSLREKFPNEEGIDALFDVCRRIRDEVACAQDVLATGDGLRIQRELPTLFRYRRATLAEVMDEFLRDTKLKAVFATLWPYLGLPPSKISFLYWSTMLAGFVTDGAFYCRGSFQNFANALGKAIRRDGGEILLKTPVRRIVVEEGRACGVLLENGQKISAPSVISNADAVQTIEDLVGKQHFSASHVKRVEKMEPSLSAFVVYLATDLPLHAGPYGHETFFYRSFNHDQNYTNTCHGKIAWFTATIPTLVDPSLAPTGEHLMILTTLMAYDIGRSWREAKSEYQEMFLQEAEQYFPGLRASLRFVESASPRTMERYTRNSHGAVYGWNVSPDQVGPSRMNVKSPLAGLYFAGHWTEPGGGVYGVVLSGIRCAQQVLGFATESELWKCFAH